jgi:hypothetical protein
MVHGTWPIGIRGTIRDILHRICPKLFSAAPPLWFQEGSFFRSRLESELRKENIVPTFRLFRWSGANSVFHRARAADELNSLLASDPDSANSIVIAHSHGGNVAFRAISKLGSRGARIHLITLATPFLQVFPTWSGPSFWFFFTAMAMGIFNLLWLRFPFPKDLIAVVIFVVFASIASALVVYFIINPSPPEAKRLLALQTNAWASRPFNLAEKTNYDSTGPHAPNLLVIRGVDDEAALGLAFVAIATRINRLALRGLWMVALLLAFAAPVMLPLLQSVLLTGSLGAESAFDLIGLGYSQSGLRALVRSAVDKGDSTLETLRLKAYAMETFVFAGIAIVLAVPALFNARFGREFLIGATRCEVATDSAPDSTRSRVITLQTPYYPPVPWLQDEQSKQTPSSASRMRHAIYNYFDCVPSIVKWINEYVR